MGFKNLSKTQSCKRMSEKNEVSQIKFLLEGQKKAKLNISYSHTL